jgi:hypothetical protein
MTRVYSSVLYWSDGEFFLPWEKKKTAWLYLDNFFRQKQVFQEVAGAASATQNSDESALLSGTDEIETANAAKQPRILLSASQWER